MPSVIVPRPEANEYAEFYAGYVAEVPADADPVEQLAAQRDSIERLLLAVPEENAEYRYAPQKWSIKEVVGHLSDAERVFSYRLMRIARGDETPLAGFDENRYVQEANFDARSLADLAAEWLAARDATLTLVRGLGTGAWERRGTASGKPVSARALLYIIIGHAQHHVGVLRTRYSLGRG